MSGPCISKRICKDMLMVMMAVKREEVLYKYMNGVHATKGCITQH